MNEGGGKEVAQDDIVNPMLFVPPIVSMPDGAEDKVDDVVPASRH